MFHAQRVGQLEQKSSRLENNFSSPEHFVLAPPLRGLGKQHVEPRACFAAALPSHLWALGLESTKNFSSPESFSVWPSSIIAEPVQHSICKLLFSRAGTSCSQRPCHVNAELAQQSLSMQAVALSCWCLARGGPAQKTTFRVPKVFPSMSLLSLCSKGFAPFQASCCSVLLAPFARRGSVRFLQKTTFRALKVCFQLLALHCLAGPAQQPFHLQAVALSC